jgi:hypothetical protein
MDKRLTIQDVHDKKRVRDFNGYQSFFDFGKYGVSIVGGAQGLYGDFEQTFEEVEGILNIFTGVPSPKKQDGGVD